MILDYETRRRTDLPKWLCVPVCCVVAQLLHLHYLARTPQFFPLTLLGNLKKSIFFPPLCVLGFASVCFCLCVCVLLSLCICKKLGGKKKILAIFSGVEMHNSLVPWSHFSDHNIQYCSTWVCSCSASDGISDLHSVKIELTPSGSHSMSVCLHFRRSWHISQFVWAVRRSLTMRQRRVWAVCPGTSHLSAPCCSLILQRTCESTHTPSKRHRWELWSVILTATFSKKIQEVRVPRSSGGSSDKNAHDTRDRKRGEAVWCTVVYHQEGTAGETGALILRNTINITFFVYDVTIA